MRSIDVSKLEPLQSDAAAGLWRLSDDRILRTVDLDGAPLSEEGAWWMFDAYRVAYDAGADTPRPFEVVRTAASYGVVVEYVQGIAMGVHLVVGSYSLEEAGQVHAQLARQMHGIVCPSGRDVGAAFRSRARLLGELLAPETGERLVSLVDAIPITQTLLHGDLHMGNVVVRGGEAKLIDMELAGFGNPAFDLAVTRARIMMQLSIPDGAVGCFRTRSGQVASTPDEARRIFWDSFLAAYLADASPRELAEADRRLAVLAEIEYCSRRLGLRPGVRASLTDAQREQYVLCERRLGELVPTLARLDLP